MLTAQGGDVGRHGDIRPIEYHILLEFPPGHVGGLRYYTAYLNIYIYDGISAGGTHIHINTCMNA